MSSVVLSVDMTFGDSASEVNLIKVTNSVGDDISDKFRQFAANNNIDLKKKEELESAAGTFAKQFAGMPWLP
ncbi:hypothetical protein [Duganella sp. LjRoot269]|jgi:hypothetical protein|uniref:hypothetical protein n=1 Tax=Duganella sp. LjRoot269 TaxID=3342305 RepID=UPI003ECD78D7